MFIILKKKCLSKKNVYYFISFTLEKCLSKKNVYYFITFLLILAVPRNKWKRFNKPNPLKKKKKI